MGTQERRERERQETRDKILDAAREMFATHGVEAVTMRAIADRIEYTPTAIYYHFKDKDSLLLSVVHADFLAFGREFARVEKIDDPVERLRRIGLAYVEFGLSHPHHYRLMFMTNIPKHDEALYGGPELGNPEEDAYQFLLATVTDGIEQGCYRPEYDDPHQLAQMMWAGVHGVVSLHIANCDDQWIDWRPIRQTAGLVIDAMIRGARREEKA